MEKRLGFFFDHESDILYITLGAKSSAISKEIGNDILVRVDPRTDKVKGLTILNLTTRFKKMKHPKLLPLVGELNLKTA